MKNKHLVFGVESVPGVAVDSDYFWRGSVCCSTSTPMDEQSVGVLAYNLPSVVHFDGNNIVSEPEFCPYCRSDWVPDKAGRNCGACGAPRGEG